MDTFPIPPAPVNPDRPADLPDELIWLEDEPAEASGQQFADEAPPLVGPACCHCGKPLDVAGNVVFCPGCDTVELPPDDAWLGEDDNGRGL